MILEEGTLNKLRPNSPPGGWFPALQGLYLCITESSFSYADLFFSPHLKRIHIYVSWSRDSIALPPGSLQTLASIVSALPTSSLERISMSTSNQTMPWTHFKDSLSSVILRCGPSFTEYDAPIPLSNAALNHLIHLPHLRTWRIHGPPPTYSASSLPLVFPPLKELSFWKGATCGWFPLLRRLEDGASTTQGVTPLSRAKESLKFLRVEDMSGVNVDPSSVSTIQCFRNLVDLRVRVYCPSGDERGQCIFKLNDDNVAELTMALTQLEFLVLGHPCSKNTCLTTVACLLPISVHCSQLKQLETHFNTANIVDDFRNILEDPRFQQLRSLPKCPLTCLDVYLTPLRLDESDLETVAKGMIGIFPSLENCNGFEKGWIKLSEQIMDLQRRARSECTLQAIGECSPMFSLRLIHS